MSGPLKGIISAILCRFPACSKRRPQSTSRVEDKPAERTLTAAVQDREFATIPVVTAPDVPPWKHWFEHYETVGHPQRSFYREWKGALEKGRPLPIGENVGYPFACGREIVRRFVGDADTATMSDAFARLDAAYAHVGVAGGMTCGWWSDCYLLSGKHEEAWAVRRRFGFRSGLSLPEAVWFREHVQPLELDGHALIAVLGKEKTLTAIGKRHVDAILGMADRFLSDYVRMKGNDILGDLLQFGARAAATTPSALWSPSRQEKLHLFWESVPGGHHIMLPSLHPAVEIVVTRGLSQVLRECENAARENLELPRIGEGWERD